MARSLIRRWLPKAHEVRSSPALRWLGPLLERPWLWRFDRRGVALGLAAGMFFGLLIPFAQSLFSGALALLLRANLPAAVLATFVSNPFTTPAIVVGAYQVGAVVLGEPGVTALLAATEGLPWTERLGAMGETLIIGLLVVASVASVLTYFAVHGAFRGAAFLRLRRLRKRSRGK